MKKILSLVCLVLFIAASLSFAQDDAYKKELKALAAQTEKLDVMIKITPIDFNGFDSWYKDFNRSFDNFHRSFYAANKVRNSYKIFQDGVQELSVAHNMLSQAKYSEDQYKESITLEQVSYAHKWKESAAEQQKAGYDAIIRSRDMFKRASEAVNGESSTEN